MKRKKLYWALLLVPLVWTVTGCGTFMAHRMMQAPNSYPTWFAPEAPVLLAFHPNFFTNFAKEYVPVGPPPAKLCYRVVEPADYQFKVSSTNWVEHGLKRTEFDFRADLPAKPNSWTQHPRGTVVLLHGYALAQFSMMPWALELAENGWRCVLVDLRGHGLSTGKQIFYGTRETHDLSQLLDQLAGERQLNEPVTAFGESYGAVMALRWKAVEPRIQMVVAISPYAGLSNAVMNLRAQYAGWLPKWLIKAGLKKLPSKLGTTASQLDTTTILEEHPTTALFVAAADDEIAPVSAVKQLCALATPESKLIIVPDTTHETVTYHFSELAEPILTWLSENNGDSTPSAEHPNSGHHE